MENCPFEIVEGDNGFSGLVFGIVDNSYTCFVRGRVKSLVEVENNDTMFCVKTVAFTQCLGSARDTSTLELSRKRYGIGINGLYREKRFMGGFNIQSNLLFEEDTLVPLTCLCTVNIKSKLLYKVAELVEKERQEMSVVILGLKVDPFQSNYLFLQLGNKTMTVWETFSTITGERIVIDQDFLEVRFSGEYSSCPIKKFTRFIKDDTILSLTIQEHPIRDKCSNLLSIQYPFEDGQSFVQIFITQVEEY